MGDNSTRLKLRNAILALEKPFCLSDLYYHMEKEGFIDRKMILQVLDELYDDGFIRYVRVAGIFGQDTMWAFKVES